MSAPEHDDSAFSDDNWIENPILVALDDELEPAWADEWTADFLEGWDNLATGPEIWQLERSQLTDKQLRRLMVERIRRRDRLVELNAPQIILDDVDAMIARAAAMSAWKIYRRKRPL